MKDLINYFNEFNSLFKMTKLEAIDFFKCKRAESLVTLERILNHYNLTEKNPSTKWRTMRSFGQEFISYFKDYEGYDNAITKLLYGVTDSEWELYKLDVKSTQQIAEELIEEFKKYPVGKIC